MTDIVREQFEKALLEYLYPGASVGLLELRKFGDLHLDRKGDYSTPWIREAWWAWRASRQSLTVTLPELKADSDADDIAGVGLVIPMFDRGYDEALEEARVAIESVGIRVEFEE